MRKQALFLLAMALTFAPCLSAMADPYMAAIVQAPGKGDIAPADALAIAREAYAKITGKAFDESHDLYTVACFLTVELYGDTQRAWHVSLQNGSGNKARMIGVAVLSPSGEVAEVRGYRTADRRGEWEAIKGPYPLWTVEDKALFYQIYEKISGDRYGKGVPQAHDLTREEAIEIAKNALTQQKRADPKAMESLILSVSFNTKLHNDPDDACQKDFWSVLFLAEDGDAPGGYREVYCANIASPDGEVYMLYNLYEDGGLNG